MNSRLARRRFTWFAFAVAVMILGDISNFISAGACEVARAPLHAANTNPDGITGSAGPIDTSQRGRSFRAGASATEVAGTIEDAVIVRD